MLDTKSVELEDELALGLMKTTADVASERLAERELLGDDEASVLDMSEEDVGDVTVLESTNGAAVVTTEELGSSILLNEVDVIPVFDDTGGLVVVMLATTTLVDVGIEDESAAIQLLDVSRYKVEERSMVVELLANAATALVVVR